MSGVNKFALEGQGKINHVVVSGKKVTSLPKKKVVTSENVTPNDEVDKGAKHLDYLKEEVVTIHKKDWIILMVGL